MNIKKVIGAGLLVALVGCEQIQSSAFASSQLPAGGSQIYLVNNFQKPQTFAPSTSGPNCNNPQHVGIPTQIPPYIPTNQPVPSVKNPPPIASYPPQPPQSQSKPRDQDKPDQSQLIVHNHPGERSFGQSIDKDGHGKGSEGRQNQSIQSESGHIHTPNNKAGDNPDDAGSKHSWRENSGNPHETQQSKDKEGKVHQIHRWLDNNGRSHETDHWTDSQNSVHQCHRWEGENGETHEAVHVTKNDGSVISEHFSKDKSGNVRKIQDKRAKSDRGDEKESESDSKEHSGTHKRQRDEEANSHKKDQKDKDEKGSASNDGHHSASAGTGPSLGNSGSIFHTANCVVSNKNLKVDA